MYSPLLTVRHSQLTPRQDLSTGQVATYAPFVRSAPSAAARLLYEVLAGRSLMAACTPAADSTVAGATVLRPPQTGFTARRQRRHSNHPKLPQPL